VTGLLPPLVCLSAFLLLSLWEAHRLTDTDIAAYYVCGRKSSALVTALSIVASCVGGTATLGMAGLAWQVGTPAFWWLGSGVAGLMILGLFLASKVRESGAITMPEMLEAYLGPASRPVASIIIVTAWLAILAAQFSALGSVIVSLVGLSEFWSVAAGAAGLLICTGIGGQAAVMRSDVWQYAILLLALLAALSFCVAAGGGESLAAVSFEAINADFPPSRLRYWLCVLGGGYVVCPMLFGRLLSARDARTARRGIFLAAAGLAVTAGLIVALGIACRSFVPAGTPPELVLSAALPFCMPPWASALVLLGLCSAVFSSADSCLMTAASILSNDILRRPGVRSCRLSMLLLGLPAFFLALSGKGILSLLLMANDIYVCGVVPPVFVGMVLYGKARLRPFAAVFAMFGGGTLGLVAAMTEVSEYSFAGLSFSLLVSLCAVKWISDSARSAHPLNAARRQSPPV